ncbi:MAG: hypothetical protein ABFC94_00145 [Syntrophomonas sp.]
MKEDQHIKLLNNIRKARAKFGYRSNLYDEILSESQLKSFELKRVKKYCAVTSLGEKKAEVSEWCWINYEPSESAKYYISGLKEMKNKGNRGYGNNFRFIV